VENLVLQMAFVSMENVNAFLDSKEKAVSVRFDASRLARSKLTNYSFLQSYSCNIIEFLCTSLQWQGRIPMGKVLLLPRI
jgi:hypothetical protein